MEQDMPNKSVRPLFMLFSFVATKLVVHIVLRFIFFLTCAPFFLDFLTLVFQIWYLALDLLSRFLLELDGFSPALFFLVLGLALTSTLDVESLHLVKDRLILFV